MGTADITRDQFSVSKRVLRKIAQRDTYIVDADFNEAGQVADYRLNEVARLATDGAQARSGSGWALTGGSNQIVVAAGQAILNISTSQSFVVTLTGNQTITGFTTPSGGNRNDVVYLDISFPIIDVGDDATLINPAVGTEACVDQRLSLAFVVLQGSIGGGLPSIPAAPTGHYYIALAEIARTSGVATISNGNITNKLRIFEPLLSYGDVSVKGNLPVDTAITIDGVDLSESVDVLYSQTLAAAYSENSVITDYDSAYANCFRPASSGSGVSNTVLKIAAYRRRNYKRIRAKFEFRQDNSTSSNQVSLTVNALTPAVFTRVSSAGAYEFVELTVDVSGVTENAILDIAIKMITASPYTGSSGIRKVVIEGVYS